MFQKGTYLNTLLAATVGVEMGIMNGRIAIEHLSQIFRSHALSNFGGTVEGIGVGILTTVAMAYGMEAWEQASEKKTRSKSCGRTARLQRKDHGLMVP